LRQSQRAASQQKSQGDGTVIIHYFKINKYFLKNNKKQAGVRFNIDQVQFFENSSPIVVMNDENNRSRVLPRVVHVDLSEDDSIVNTEAQTNDSELNVTRVSQSNDLPLTSPSPVSLDRRQIVDVDDNDNDDDDDDVEDKRNNDMVKDDNDKKDQDVYFHENGGFTTPSPKRNFLIFIFRNFEI